MSAVLAPHQSGGFEAPARAYCQRTLVRNSKSFAFAARLLPANVRHDAAVLYTFCRGLDDAVDHAEPGSERKALARFESIVASIYRGEPQPEPHLDAFAGLVVRAELPREYLCELLAGMRMDVSGARYETLQDLLLYCHRVAGVVGLMMCHLLGVERDEALSRAAHLGIAFQLTNICRDLAEDWQRGRLYVPRQILEPLGCVDLDRHLGGPIPDWALGPLSRATANLLLVAEAFYQSADRGLDLLSPRSAFAIRTARSVYSRIGHQLRAQHCNPLARRAVVPRAEKLWLLSRSAFSALIDFARRLRRPPVCYQIPSRIMTFRDNVLPEPVPERISSERSQPSFARDLATYVGRIRQFNRTDWIVYLSWVGLIFGLFGATLGLLLAGRHHGVSFPVEAWLLPVGAFVFAVSIAVDTIGHRTIYKEEISRAEGLVHHITIFTGIASSVLLCAAYSHPHGLWIPALVMTALSLLYSLVDEAFHWRRYVRSFSDRVEMWSHVGILTGHSTLMIAWWWWFFDGYVGVAETLPHLGWG